MQIISKVLYVPSRTSRITIWPISDTHLGARAVNEKLLKEHIQHVANDEFAYWMHLGDAIDGIGRKDQKRHMESTMAEWCHGENDVIGAQEHRVLDLLDPIAGKCLALLPGNHEYAVLKYQEHDAYRNIVRSLARSAKVEPDTLGLGVQGILSLLFRRGNPQSYRDSWRLNFYLFHGSGHGSLPGGHALALGRVLGNNSCQIAIMGHRHIRQYVDKVITGVSSTGKMVQEHRAAIFVASYLNAWVKPAHGKLPIDTYVDQIGAPPVPVGTTPIVIYPDEREFDFIMGSGRTALELVPQTQQNIIGVAA